MKKSKNPKGPNGQFIKKGFTVGDVPASERAILRQIFDRLDDDASKRLRVGRLGVTRWWAVSQEIGVSTHTISHWVRHAKVPRRAVMTILHVYPRLVKACDLRPNG